MLCTASDKSRILAYWELFIQVAYSALLRHIHAYWGIVKAYLTPCVTLTYWKLCDIPCPSRSRAGGIFKTLWNFDQAYSEPCHSQNSLFRHYSGIFRTLCNSCICSNLAYLKSWNIQNPSIIASLRILRTLRYLPK